MNFLARQLGIGMLRAEVFQISGGFGQGMAAVPV